MTNNIARADLFPTTVFARELDSPDALNATLLQAIHAERVQGQTDVELSNFTRLGGWHSRTTLHKEPEFAFIASAVRETAAALGEALGYDPTRRLDIDAMWAIVNAPGAWNRAHIHPGSLWSGVYYVQAGENAGQIELMDPRTANVMRQPRYAKRPEACCVSVTYDPTPGRMLLFPSWLYHTVHPNLSDAERVILSFNLSQY